jgi:hypothetical protein
VFWAIFSVVEPNGSQEVTPEDVLVPAFSSNVLQHFGSVPARSKMFDDAGGHFLIPPRPVLTTVAWCFPQVLSGMLSDFFQHPSSSLGVFRFDGPASARLIQWPPFPHGGIFPLPFILDLLVIDGCHLSSNQVFRLG